MKLLEKDSPAININPLTNLEKIETKIEEMIKKILELKSENEALRAELEFYEKNSGKNKILGIESDDFLNKKKKAKDLLESLLEKFSKSGI